MCDVPAISLVCDTAGEAAGTLVAAPFEWLAAAMGATAGWMFETVWTLFDTTTLVDLTNPGYVSVYNLMFGIAITLMLGFFVAQLITGLLRRDPHALGKAVTGLGKSVIGSFLALSLTGLLLEVVDQLSVGIVHAAGTSMEELGARMFALFAGLTAVSIQAPGVGAIVTIFLSGLAVGAATLVWFTMLVRKSLLLVAVVLAPIALSGLSWEATRSWFSRWASFVVALAVSKLVVVVVFLVGTAQVGAPIDFDLQSIADPVAGVVLLFIAAFAPYMAYKLIAFAGFDAHNTMSAEQEAKAALSRPVPIATRPGMHKVRQVLEGGRGAGPAGSGTSSAPTPSAPHTAGHAAAETSAGTAGATAGGGAAAGVAVAAAGAGPRLGGAVGRAAEGHSSGGQRTSDPGPSAAAAADSSGGSRPPGSGSPVPRQPVPPPTPGGRAESGQGRDGE